MSADEYRMRQYMESTYDWDREHEVLDIMKKCQRNWHYKKFDILNANLKKHMIDELLYVAENSPSKQYESHYDIYWTADRKVIEEISKYTWGNTHRRHPPSTWRNTQANASIYIVWVAKEPPTQLNANADGSLKSNTHHERWFNSYCSIGISLGLTMRAAVKMGFHTGANKSHNDLNGDEFWEKKLGIVDDVRQGKKRIAYGLGIGYPQDNRPRWESDDTELMIGASNGSKLTTTGQDIHKPSGMKARKVKLINIRGNENKRIKDDYGNVHTIPENSNFKINSSAYKRDIKIIEIK